MKTMLVSVFAAVAIGLLAGCSGEVDKVKGGTLQAYPQATIGDIFKANFDGGKWTSEKKDGKTIVTFSGKISQKLHDRVYANIKNFEAFDIGTSFRDDARAKQAAFHDSNVPMKELEKQIAKLKENSDRIDKELAQADEAVKAAELKHAQTPSGGLHDQQDAQLEKLNDRYRELLTQQSNEQNAIKPALEPLNEKNLELRIEQESKDDKFKSTLYKELAHKYWWPAGSGVEFKWIVYPDGKKFEILSAANNSWNEYRISVSEVYATLYGN
jgi:hypothetical protein